MAETFEDMNPKQPEPLSVVHRMILQNFFDTNPKQRAALLKKLGYEMNPKDDNEYRPIGSTGGYAEVDPGISAYFKKGGLAEVAKDFGDIAYDAAVTSPAVTVGAAKGGAVGAAAGSALPGAGTAVLGVAGGILGGAAGNAASEALKQNVARLMLDESVPPEYMGIAAQSLIVGAAPKLFQAGAKLAKEGYGLILDRSRKAIVNAMSSGGSRVTSDTLEYAAKNPDMFTKEAVKGATERLRQTYRGIFGMDDPIEIKAPENIKEGLFRKVLDPLNSAADAEIETLAKNPQANFSLEEISAPIKKKIGELSDKFDRTAEEKEALTYLREKLNYLNSKFKPSKESKIVDQFGREMTEAPRDASLSYKDAREFLQSVQSDAFDREVGGSGVLRQVFGGNSEAVRGLLDAKAAQAGSRLPAINAERSRILKVYNQAAKTLTPQNIETAFLTDNPEKIRKADIQAVATEMDNILGTKLTDSIRSGAMQQVVQSLYQNKPAFGSGRVMAETIAGGAKGALTGLGAGAGIGALTGVGIGPGAATGAIAGGAAGALRARSLATPERALEDVISLTKKLDSGRLVSPVTESVLGAAGKQAALQTTKGVADRMLPIVPEANASQDPFADLDSVPNSSAAGDDPFGDL